LPIHIYKYIKFGSVSAKRYDETSKAKAARKGGFCRNYAKPCDSKVIPKLPLRK